MTLKMKQTVRLLEFVIQETKGAMTLRSQQVIDQFISDITWLASGQSAVYTRVGNEVREAEIDNSPDPDLEGPARNVAWDKVNTGISLLACVALACESASRSAGGTYTPSEDRQPSMWAAESKGCNYIAELADEVCRAVANADDALGRPNRFDKLREQMKALLRKLDEEDYEERKNLGRRG